MANRTHTKTVHKPHAAQRLAISRVRQDSTGLTEATALAAPLNGKIAPTEHVGCMAVFGGIPASIVWLYLYSYSYRS